MRSNQILLHLHSTRIILLVFCGIIGSNRLAIGQADPFLSPSLRIQGTAFSPRQTDTLNGSNETYALAMTANFPLWKKNSHDSSRWTIGANFRNQSIFSHDAPFFTSKVFQQTSAGFQGVYLDLKRTQGMFFAAARSLWMSETSNWFQNNPRLSGLLLYHRLSRAKFLWQAGITYSYLSGNARLWPILGFQYAFNQHTNLRFVFPFNLSYQWKKNQNRNLIFLRPNGTFAEIEPSENQKASTYRRAEMLLGYRFSKFQPKIRYFIEAGFASRGRLNLNQQVLQVSPGVFCLAGITFILHTQSSIGEEELNEILPDWNLWP